MKKILSIALIFLMVFASALTAYAAGDPILPLPVDSFEDLSGEAKYINNSDNYYLDLVETGILDVHPAMMNETANVLFGVERLIVKITCTGFYYITSTNFGDALATPINAVQKSLKEYMFDPMATLIILISGFWIAVMMAKRNLQEILNQTIKVICVVVSATILAQNSATVISMVDDVTSTLSNSLLSAVSLQGVTAETYGETTAVNLWLDLIHTPWKSLEFGTSKIENEAEAVSDLLDAPPRSEERKAIVSKLAGDKKDPKVFGLGMPVFRLWLIPVHYIPVILMCALYLIIALLQLAFRLLTIFLVFVGFFVLLMSLLPFLGGLNLLKKWALKIAEMQIMVLSMSFMFGFMVLINSLIFELVGSHGWLISHILRAGIFVCIFVFRGKIFGFMADFQHVVHESLQRPQLAGFNARMAIDGRAERMGNVGTAIQQAPQAMHNSLTTIKDLAGRIGSSIHGEAGRLGGSFEPNLRIDNAITPDMYY